MQRFNSLFLPVESTPFIWNSKIVTDNLKATIYLDNSFRVHYIKKKVALQDISGGQTLTASTEIMDGYIASLTFGNCADILFKLSLRKNVWIRKDPKSISLIVESILATVPSTPSLLRRPRFMRTFKIKKRHSFRPITPFKWKFVATLFRQSAYYGIVRNLAILDKLVWDLQPLKPLICWIFTIISVWTYTHAFFYIPDSMLDMRKSELSARPRWSSRLIWRD